MDEIAALKKALIGRLLESSAVVFFTGDRVYDVIPVEPSKMTSPYIAMGQFTSSDDGPECFETFDVIGQIDVYSWGTGEAASTMEGSKIAAAVKAAVVLMLSETPIDLTEGFVLSDIRVRSHRVITASDGVTKHVPITISAIVDKT